MKTFVLFKRLLIASVLLCFCAIPNIWAQQTIVIGSSAKANHPFSQFDSLLTEISAGNLNGQLTLAFEPGSYKFSKALIINTANFTTKDHLTITSTTKNCNDVVFFGQISTGLVQLNKTNNVTFSHLSLHQSGSAGHVIAFEGPTENVTFYHCDIRVTYALSGANPAGKNSCIGHGDKSALAAPVKNFQLIGNTLANGCRNYIKGSKTNTIQGMRIDSNVIEGTYDGCFGTEYCYELNFNHNRCMPSTVINASSMTVTLYAPITMDSLCGNILMGGLSASSTATGAILNMSGCTTPKGGNVLVANNIIIGKLTNTSSESKLVNIYNGSTVDFLHNSIYNDNVCKNATVSATTGIKCLLVDGSTTAITKVRCIGNQIVANKSNSNQFPIRISANAAGNVEFDYNNYWNWGGPIGYYNDTLVKDMKAWVASLPKDVNSISMDPSFIDPTKDLQLNSYYDFVMPNIGINTDYEGTLRGKTTSMGAYTITLKDNDAALSNFAQTAITAEKPSTVFVTLTNSMQTALTSAVIQWSVGNKLQTPFKWIGKLAFGESDTLKLGDVTAPAGQWLDLSAWVEDPNGAKDEYSGNDTVKYSEYLCKGPFNGTYTVGKGMDFATLDEALSLLDFCGINGPVTLLMENSKFGQLTFSGSIKGSSPTNRITIMPAKGASVTIDAGSASSSFVLNGASNYVFENLNIGNTTDAPIGIEIMGQNEYITFRNCRIHADKTAGNGNFAAIWYKSASNASSYPVELNFINNDIWGGYYNAYLMYVGGTAAQMMKSSINFEGNTFRDAQHSAVYANYYYRIPKFNSNTVIGRYDYSSTFPFVGFYANNNGCMDQVIGNRIQMDNNGSGGYGLFFNTKSLDGANTGKQACHVYNNEIIVIGDKGNKAGIKVSSPNCDMDIRHNSIFVKDSTGSAATYGMDLQNNSTSYQLKAYNNMVFCEGVGNSVYALYLGNYGATSYGNRGYNNLYTNGTIAYSGSARKTVAALQSATKSDLNTVSVLPVFADFSKGLQLAVDTAFRCPMDTNVTTDINGTKRSATTDMGCYDAVASAPALPGDAALKNFVGLDKITAAAPGQISVVVVNKDTTPLSKADINLLIDGVAQTPYTYAPATPLAQGAEETVAIGTFNVTAGTHVFTAFIDLPGGDVDHSNDTIVDKVNICAQAYSGSFVINSVAQFDSLINEFNTCGANGDITIAFANGSYKWTKALEINTAFMNGNRLTITSVAKDRDSVIFECNVSLNNAGFIKLNNTNNVTFSHISLQMKNTNGHTVCFYGPTDGVTFYHCNIAVTSGGTGGTNCCFGAQGDNKDITAPVKNFKLIGNNITAGCRNTIKGTATNRIQGFRLDSNVITGTKDGCFTLNYADDIAVNFNTAIPMASTTSWPAGISLGNVTGDSIYGNLVNFSNVTIGTFGGNALSVSGDTASKKRFLIANNVFIGRNNAAYRKTTTDPAISKVVSLNSINCDFVHNSIYNTRSSSTPTGKYTAYGVFPLYLAGNGSDVKCAGNQIIAFNAKNQYPLYVSNTMKNFTADYNNYYSGDTVIAIYNGDGAGAGSLISSVADLAKVTGGDAHSVSIAPVFVDSTVDLQLKNYSDYVMPNIGINTDYEGTLRGKTTTMGAYTVTLHANDAALTAILSPNTQSPAKKSTPIDVVLTNFGTDTLKSADIAYNDGLPAFAYQWTGKLAMGQSDTVRIGSTIPAVGLNKLTAYVSYPNGKTDANTANDTLTISYTAVQKVLDIEVTQLVSPDANSFVGAITPMKVKLTNIGTDTVKSFTLTGGPNALRWTSKAWTGMLLPRQDTVIYLRDVTPTKGANSFTAYVCNVNGTGLKDNNQKNDTLKVSLNITREPGDASLTEFIGLEKVNPNVGVPVYVVVYNKGTKAIDKASINFSINGVAQKAYTYQPKVALAQSKFDTVNLGFFTAKAGKTTFIASITMTDDMEPTNDTIKEIREVYFTDYKLNEIVSPKAITEATCFGDKMPIAIAVSNTGKLDADFAANPMKISVSVSGAYKYQLDTAIEKGLLKANALDTFLLGFIPTTAVGSYTINVTLGGDADYDNSNNNAKAEFEVTSIAIPYDNNLSAASKELVFNQVGGVHWDYVPGTGHIAVAPVYGKGYLEFAGEKEKGAKASIVMNGVHIQNFNNPKLSFWYAHTAAKDQGDMLVVKATTDGGATYTELGKLAPAAAKDEWKRYDFDLNKFSSEKCLSIVLEATSAGMNQGIDRIVLTAEQDAAISLMPADVANYSACSNDPIDIKAIITNVSDMDVELTNDTIAFKVSGAVQASGNYVYTRTLKAKTADTLTIGKFVPANNGRYFVEVIMQSQDDKTANDTLRDSSITIMQDVALVALEGIDAQTVKTAGDTVTVNALMVNTGNTVIRSSKLQMKINGNEVISTTCNNVIGIGDTAAQALTYIVPFATKANPTYTLDVTAGFDCDGDSTNNSIQLIAQVNVPDTIDIQVLDITANDTMGKAQVRPTVRIANIGNTDAADVKLHVLVYDSADNMIANIAGTIESVGMNDTLDYTCDSAYTVPNYNGMYRLVAFVEANASDNNLNNDTLNRQFNCHLDDTRISESSDMNWNMGQNYPNPASNVTRIPLTMPQDAAVVFSVMSVNGQMIYREVIAASAGNNSVDFNVDNLANGVYYYSMECNGQRFVKKMNVAR